MYVSIISPLYNEEHSLINLTRRISVSLQAEKISGEIILVNDGSEDNSSDILKDIQNKWNEDIKLHVFHHKKRS